MLSWGQLLNQTSVIFHATSRHRTSSFHPPIARSIHVPRLAIGGPSRPHGRCFGTFLERTNQIFNIKQNLKKLGGWQNDMRNCSRSECKKPAVVKRWLLGIGPCPALIVYLCCDCKDILLWNDDVIREEKIEQKDENMTSS